MKILARILIALMLVQSGQAFATQATIPQPTTGPHSMSDLNTNYLNPALQTLLTNNKGPSAPASPQLGMFWINDTSNPWVVDVYDGTWVPIGTIDATGHVFTFSASALPALTGDVTTIVGNAVTTIATGVVTNAKLANMLANTTKCNNTGATGVPVDCTASQEKANLAISSGDVSGLAPSATTDTTNATNISSGTLAAGRLPALTGDVTTTIGTAATTIAANAVTNAKAAQMAASTTKCNNTGSLANSVDCTAAQEKTMLAIASGDVSGLAPSATTDTTNAANISSGTLAAARLPAMTGDVTASVGTHSTTIASAAVSLAKMANLAANSFICNNTGSGTTPIACTVAQAKSLLAIVRADITDWGTGVQAALGNATNAASGIVTEDANSNVSANDFTSGIATVATAAGTTTLVAASAPTQRFTGATTQTLVLPAVAGLVNNRTFKVINESSGAIAVQSSGANLILSVAGSTTAFFAFNGTAGTGIASWSVTNAAGGGGGGTPGGASGNIQYNNGGAFGGLTLGGNLAVNGTVLTDYAVSTRQTVTFGPDTTAGLSNFLPSTSASLSITAQNVSSGTPLIVTAAQGANSAGALNTTWIFTTGPTWTSVTASNTDYLYVNTSSGATGFTTLVPIYQYGGTPSVTSGQFTFNVSEMTGYMGNGSTAPATPIVFMGEVVAGASTITSTIAYAYNGYYDSGYTATLPTSGLIPKNSNLGVAQHNIQLIVQNTAIDGNYAVGDLANGITVVATNIYPVETIPTRTTSAFVAGTGWNLLNKTTFAPFALTVADWKYKVIATRGW